MRAKTTFSAIVVALLTLIVCFWLFRWGFIQLWEWQHEGRRMVFVIDPEVKAAALAVLPSVAAFLFMLRRSLNQTKS